MLYDCIIIGSGPAGLMAAIYLARYRRKILIIANKKSRAHLIPCSHNYPGSINGISGKKLIANLQSQLAHYSHTMKIDCIDIFKKNNKTDTFLVYGRNKIYESKYIVIATGVTDMGPDVPFLKQKIREGFLRHCVICDGYEVIDHQLAVLGHNQHAYKQVISLLPFTKNIVILTMGVKTNFSKNQIKELKKHKIRIIETPITKIRFYKKDISLLLSDESRVKVNDIYSALGSHPNSDMAKKSGVLLTKDLFIKTNRNQKTNIKGVFAVGDISKGLSQMCVGFAHAAVAATEIHSQLLKNMQRNRKSCLNLF